MAADIHGRLGVGSTDGTNHVTIYSCPTGRRASVNINLCNTNTTGSCDLKVAIVDGGLGDLVDEDYIEYGFSLAPSDAMERTGCHLKAGETVLVWSDKPDLMVRVHGIERDDLVSEGVLHGRLGVATLAATTNTIIYTVPVGKQSTVNVNYTNRSSSETNDMRLAVMDSDQIGDLATEDFIEYDFTMAATDTVERTGIAMKAGESIVAYAEKAVATIRVHGVERDV